VCKLQGGERDGCGLLLEHFKESKLPYETDWTTNILGEKRGGRGETYYCRGKRGEFMGLRSRKEKGRS